MTKTRARINNLNYSTDILWRIIDKYHQGNCAACARYIKTTNQRLCYLLGYSSLLTPTLAAKIRYYYPEENLTWDALMLPYDVQLKHQLLVPELPENA